MSAHHMPEPDEWKFVQGGSGDFPTWSVHIGDAYVRLPAVFDMEVMDAIAHLIIAAPELLAALITLDERLHECAAEPITAAEAYDSFYQEIVASAIAKAMGAAS